MIDEDIALAMQRQVPFQNPFDKYAGMIVEMTDTEDTLYRIELALSGKKLDSNGNPVTIGRAKMNTEGINTIMGILRSTVNKETIMSNLSKNGDMQALMELLADTIAKNLMMNKVKYQIESNSDRDIIFWHIMNTVYITMKRADEEGERRFWKGSQQEISTRVVNNQGGLLSGMNPFKKRQ